MTRALALTAAIFAAIVLDAHAATPDGFDASMLMQAPVTQAPVTQAPVQVITATSSSTGWQVPTWVAAICFLLVLAVLALALRWAIPAIQANAFLKRHAMAQAVLQRIAEAALVVVQELQQKRPAGATGEQLLNTAIASVKDQLTGENGAAVAAKIIGVDAAGLDKIITSNVEASVLQVKAAIAPPAPVAAAAVS